MLPYKIFLLFVLSFISSCSCQKPGKKNTSIAEGVLTGKVLTDNLNHPWEILWGPDNFIWMTERTGRISKVNPANGQVSLVFTVPDVQSNGEGGLLGMVLHPSFSVNSFLYIIYNYN